MGKQSMYRALTKATCGASYLPSYLMLMLRSAELLLVATFCAAESDTCSALHAHRHILPQNIGNYGYAVSRRGSELQLKE